MNARFFVRAQADFGDELSPEEAYRRLLPEISAVLPEDRVKINLDIPAVVATVLGLLPGILALRDRAASLAEFDVTPLDRLEDSALALGHAHARWAAMSRPSDDLAELNLEATQTRERLHADAMGMCYRKLLDESSLRDYTGSSGYKRVASDVLLLVALFRGNWSRLAGRCPCDREELDRAEKLAVRMLRLVGLRDKASATLAEASDTRTRAFTLLLRYYDAARRAVTFLRWPQGDADSIAPSLYTIRTARRRKEEESSTAPEQQEPQAFNSDSPVPPTAIPSPSPITGGTGNPTSPHPIPRTPFDDDSPPVAGAWPQGDPSGPRGSPFLD